MHWNGNRTWLLGGAFSYAVAAAIFFLEGARAQAEHLFNSDALYAAALYADLADGRYPLSGWKLQPAPHFFPDMPLYFLLRSAAGSAHGAALAYAVVQPLLLAVCAAWCVQQARPEPGGRLRYYGAALFPAAIALLTQSHGPGIATPWTALLLPGHHAQVAINGALTLGFAVSWLRRPGWRPALGLMALLAAGIVSNGLFLFLIPPTCLAAAVLHGLYALRRGAGARRFATTAAWIVCGALLGLWLEGALRRANWFLLGDAYGRAGPPEPDAFLNFERWADALQIVLVELPAGPGPFTLAALCACFLLCGALALSSFRPRLAPAEQVLRLAPFLLAIGNGGALLYSAFAFGVAPMRYAAPLAAILLLAPALLVAGARIRPALRQRIGGGCAALFLAGAIASATNIDLANPAFAHRPPTALCIDRLAERYPLERGFADYWMARPLQHLSAAGPRVLAVGDQLGPGSWLNNYFWYFGRPDDPPATFLVTHALDLEAVRRRFGPPDAKESCGGADFWFYLRPEAPIRRHLRATPAAIEAWREATGR